MNTHESARICLHAALKAQGFASCEDRCAMIESTLQACRKAACGHEEIVAERLGLELEYILPLLRPQQEMYLSALGVYKVRTEQGG